MTVPFSLHDFVAESNSIENIHRPPTLAEIAAHEAFLGQDPHADPLGALENFVNVVAGVPLRRGPGMDVRVGSHHPPRGGPGIEAALERLLRRDDLTPYERHVLYETLHPFMDGNGRSGRVLWLRDMGGISRAPLGFLHTWYYQSLDASHYRHPDD